MASARRGFAWWDTHERGWRRARLLFGLAVVVVSLYVAGFLFVGLLFLRVVGRGPGAQIDRWVDDVGLVVLVPGGAALLVLLAALAVAVIGWRGLPRTTVRLSRAHHPRGDEARRVQSTLAAFALAYGMPAPKVGVIDDPAPNAVAFGRPRSAYVCVTRGALRLPADELEALCAFHVTALASRVFAYATAAADLVLVGEWCTRVVWASGFLGFFSPIVGVPLDAALAYVLAVAVLVVATRPLLIVADRGIVRLLDEAAELVDLETIEHSAQPAAMARLLLDLVEDTRQAKSKWEIAHLWFERDVVEPVEKRPSGMTSFFPSEVVAPAFASRCGRLSRRRLIERAEVAVDLATADSKLRSRLARAKERSVAGNHA